MKQFLTKTNLISGAAILVLILFIGAIQAILLPFILALVLAYILRPMADKLERAHLSNGMASGIITVGFCLCVVALLLILVPVLQTQIIDFIRQIPRFSNHVWDYLKAILMHTKDNMTQAQINELSDAVSGSVTDILSAVGAGLSHLLSSGLAIFNMLALLIITPVVLFYVLRDWKEIQMTVHNLIPKAGEAQAQSIWDEINRTLSGFIRGQALVCLGLALYYATALSLVGLDFGILIGLLAGILSFIPYIGFGTGLVLSLFLALMQGFSAGQWGGLAVIFIVGQILEGYVLTPYLVGNKVGLHPVWIIFALLAGGVLAGFVGILLAVPVAAVAGVLIRRGLKWYRQTAFYTGKEAPKK